MYSAIARVLNINKHAQTAGRQIALSGAEAVPGLSAYDDPVRRTNLYFDELLAVALKEEAAGLDTRPLPAFAFAFGRLQRHVANFTRIKTNIECCVRLKSLSLFNIWPVQTGIHIEETKEMTHWLVHPLRGWLAFLSLTNLGTGLRCLWEDNFLQQRIFTKLKCADVLRTMPILSPPFARSVFSMTVCSLALYLGYFGNELIMHRSISNGGAAFFPIFLSALTMTWLLVAWKFIRAPRRDDDADENEQLAERLSLHSLRRQRRSKHS
ncbi:hypothetical protein HPB49_025406 [Dermacentor silvarum]|uniref:Uncharacterized protein n=1 Tax=Dermacentor silvarum TaxID=543639 RepID=A0ACB8CIJ7_DERSI|nr:hypothetical protein HPB49_025406 [Dermacentor silvarum]